VECSPDTGHRTAAGRGDSSGVHLTGISAAGTENQIAVHRKLVRREAAVENLGIHLKKLFTEISHTITPVLLNRITEV